MKIWAVGLVDSIRQLQEPTRDVARYLAEIAPVTVCMSSLSLEARLKWSGVK